MDAELERIFADARSQIARGEDPDVEALEERVRGVDPRALPRLRRLLAVHRARRSLARELTPPAPPPTLRPRSAPPAYRAKPTIAANIAVRARAADDGVVLEWDPARGVTSWDVRIADRADARSPYVDRERRTLDAPRLELAPTELPLRISIAGRNANGRIVQRALITGLTSSNWNQKWQQRASAS